MTSSIRLTPETFPLIDVMRALAALMVLVYHVIVMTGWHSFPTHAVGTLFREGWAGVDMFLVISGFVITLSAHRERSNNPAVYRLAFLQRRFWRIAPLYVLTCLLFVFLVKPQILAATWDVLAIQAISHGLFLHNLHHTTHGAVNGPSWSIALEMQFYLLVVFTIPWLVKQKPWWVVMALTVVAWAYRWMTTMVWVPGEAEPIIQMIYATQLPGTLDNFAFGIALALLRIHNPTSPWISRNWRTCGMWSVLACVLTWAWWAVLMPRIQYWPYWDMIVFWRTLLAASSAAWLAVLITCPVKGDGLWRPVCYLGKISYGIYLWHMPVLLSLLQVPNLWGGKLLLAVLVGTLTLAAFSWHAFERPLSTGRG